VRLDRLKRSLRRVWMSLFLVCVTGSVPAIASAPDAPSNPNPQDGATDVPASAQLCADVYDPQGGELDVRFLARDPSRSPAEPFTIIFLPDTQYYSQTFPEIFMAQTQWIVENREALNVVFVSHLGDVVQLAKIPAEWDNAAAAMSLLEDPATTELPDGIPYGLSVGNHDQDLNNRAGTPSDPGETTTNFNAYFGLSRFAGREYFGGHHPDNNDNSYQLFEAGGMEFIVIHHEFDDTYQTLLDEALEWTDGLLTTFRDRRAIISSHSLLCTATVCPSTLEAEFSSQGLATYEALKHHSNLFLMHCGHAASSHQQPRRADTFEGHTIHTLLANYQRGEDCPLWCGNGWLRIMTFYPAEDRIAVRTFSPWLDTFRSEPCLDGNSCHEFELAYDMEQGIQFEEIGRVTGIASGMSACQDWPARRDGVEYEWFVEVSDAASTVSSPKWTFTSTGQCGIDADCQDGNNCTDDLCLDGICAALPRHGCCEADADCDDGNYCTEDSCDGLICTHTDNSNACDDGDACTDGDSCAAGVCSGVSVLCDDGNACTGDSCYEGECLSTYTPAAGCCVLDSDCADGNPCTDDRCESEGACVNAPVDDCCLDDATCDDGDACTATTCLLPNSSAVHLNGQDQHVTMGRAMELGLVTFTLECWFKWDGGATAAATSGYPYDSSDTGGVVAYPLITKGVVDTDIFTYRQVNYFLGISESTHVLAADFEEHWTGTWRSTNHSVTGTTAVTPGVWHHAAVAYDGVCWQLYLDGEPETDGTNCPAEPPAYESQGHLAIGTAQDFNGGVHGRFGGSIDEVRIWDRALDALEIEANLLQQVAPRPDLVGHWSFNERTGFISPDTSGNGHDAVLVHASLETQNLVNMGGNVCVTTPLILGAADGLSVAGVDPTALAWGGQTAGELSDVISGALDHLRADGTIDRASCIADGATGSAASDSRPVPLPGAGHYYVVRTDEPCGSGNYGYTSDGLARISATACP
jgi:hypothetical protein